MRFVVLASGFLGFLLVTLAGISAGRAIDVVLRDAAFGTIASGMLGRWFWRVLQNAAVATAAQRREEAERAAAAEAAKDAAAQPPASVPASAVRSTPPTPAPAPSSGSRAAVPAPVR